MEPRNLSSNISHLSYEAIAGVNYGGDSGIRTSVAVKPIQNALSQDSGLNNAYMSLDGLFTPFVVNNSTGNYPVLFSGNYNLPVMYPSVETKNNLANSAASGDINAVSLNPFESINLYYDNSGNYHGIALRGPVIIAGWGSDKNNNLVPSGVSNYKERPDTWKVGPLDIKWNDPKQLWEAGSSFNIIDLVKQGDGSYLGNEGQISGIQPETILGLEYTTVCSGEIIQAFDSFSYTGKYVAITRPTRAVRVITGIECVNNVLYLQYAFIGVPFVSAGYKIVNQSGTISLENTSNICDAYASQPAIIGFPLSG